MGPSQTQLEARPERGKKKIEEAKRQTGKASSETVRNQPYNYANSQNTLPGHGSGFDAFGFGSRRLAGNESRRTGCGCRCIVFAAGP